MTSRPIAATVLALVTATGLSCSATAMASAVRHVTPHAVSVTTPQSERTAVSSLKWTSNVAASIGQSDWTFTSTGIPASHFTASHYAVPSNVFNVSAVGASVVTTTSTLRNQHLRYTIPLTPQYSTTTSANLGAIGVLLDGAVLYNPYEANAATVATADNFKVTKAGVTASFLDSCNGHPGPGGQYHYHGLPACLVAYATAGSTSQVVPVTSFTSATTPGVAETNALAKAPVLLGFAFDGYGIYDNVAEGGATVPVAALDACNGVFSAVPGYPAGIYHYVLENVKSSRSSIDCYHGVVSSAYTQALGHSITAMDPSADVSAITQALQASSATRTGRLRASSSVVARLTSLFKVLSAGVACG